MAAAADRMVDRAETAGVGQPDPRRRQSPPGCGTVPARGPSAPGRVQMLGPRPLLVSSSFIANTVFSKLGCCYSEH